MSYIGDNDDDLFSYDPSEDTGHVNTATIQENIEETISEENSVFDISTTKTLLAFFETQAKFFADQSNKDLSFFKSVHHILDEITDNRFTLLHYYYDLQTFISKKKILLSLNEAFLNIFSSDESDNFTLSISEDFSIDIDFQLFSAITQSNMRIIRYSIDTNIFIYEKVAEMLGIEPEESLIDPTNHRDYVSTSESSSSTPFSSVFINGIYTYNYSSHVENLRKSIIESLKETDLLEKIQQNFASETTPFFHS